jgi:aryl-phospho-beta-D-glucosidase BglC (GH1 family)
MPHSRPSPLSRREFVLLTAGSGLAATLPACAARPTAAPVAPPGASVDPTASPLDYRQLPRWRGFNLLEKFTLQNNQPYLEWDFDCLARWGFDFVRLPTDYRIWTSAPGQYREAPLREIDQAIEWGRQRKIHVDFALHRAPGYSVNRSPVEPLDLWGDGPGAEAARRQFTDQWRMFATRYRGIPSRDLSFNLVNEPAGITGAQYLRVARAAVEAIRAVDPERLVVADGTDYGRHPVPELVALRVAQSTRGYSPMQLTHYRAAWVDGADRWPVPSWPIAATLNQYLYGPLKPEYKSALVLRGEFPAGAELSITVLQVSQHASLVIQADGATLLEKHFDAGAAGGGEWRESVFKPEWKIYQALYDRVYTAKLPASCRELRVELLDGDWLTFGELRVVPTGGGTPAVNIAPNDAEWGTRQREFTLDPQGRLAPAGDQADFDQSTLFSRQVKPWQDFAASHHVGIHVGEWGAHAHTPHAVVLAWMKDCLANWRRAGLGWALWNLRGSFGCLDSQRKDVEYESYQGHLLDRRMLELLRSDAAV